MKKLLILPLLMLTACQTTSPTITTTKHTVILPSDSMYNCPTLVYYPKVETLTDIQAARLIVDLHKNNSTCKNSMNSIKRFLEESKKTVEEEQSAQ